MIGRIWRSAVCRCVAVENRLTDIAIIQAAAIIRSTKTRMIPLRLIRQISSTWRLLPVWLRTVKITRRILWSLRCHGLSSSGLGRSSEDIRESGLTIGAGPMTVGCGGGEVPVLMNTVVGHNGAGGGVNDQGIII